MPVPTSRTDLSTTAANNSPAGSDSAKGVVDNYFRAHAQFIRENYNDIQDRPTSAALAASSGASLVGYGSDTVDTALDAVNLADYAALRSFTGSVKAAYVTGYLASAAPTGIAGRFTVDDSDTTSADNGGTIIVADNGKRWKRVFSGPVDIEWFGAKLNGATDDQAAYDAAIAYIDATAFGERSLYIRGGGNLALGKMDFTNKADITIQLGGTVQVTGIDDTQGFIFGSTNYNSGSPSSSTVSRRIRVIGGSLLIGPKAGESYDHALRLEHFVSSDLQNVFCSGDYAVVTSRGTLANARATVYIQYCYLNAFIGGSVGSPGSSGASGGNYSVYIDNNNCNGNYFSRLRLAGANDLGVSDQTAFRINGNDNVFHLCDVSGIKNGYVTDGSRGTQIIAPYCEATNYPVYNGAIGTGTTRVLTVRGGYIEVLSNSIGIILSASATTLQGADIRGVRFKGASGGSSRTAIHYGSNAYTCSVDANDYESIDTTESGAPATGGGLGPAQLANGAIRASASGVVRIGSNSAFSAGREIGSMSGASTGSGTTFYEVGNTSYSTATAAQRVARDSTTSRSINAAGTLNASGADYAEYMRKAFGCGEIAKGAIVGINAAGEVTDVWADAVAFAVKSTDPSFVGGDTWCRDLGPEPELADGATGEQIATYEAAMADYVARREAARVTVDRIAFAGQVPVNVLGATPGDYIVPIQDGDGITGIAVSSPTFEQYRLAVGKVIAIEDDGRARIIVKIG